MRILLINTNVSRGARQGMDATPAPLGLMTLASLLLCRGHEVRIVQARAHVLPQDEEALPLVEAELAPWIRDFAPDLVGLSARNVGAARRPRNPLHLLQYFSVFYDARLARGLRRLTSAPVVLGGTAFSLEPRLYMKVAAPDFGLVGEAEHALVALVDALETGQSTEGLPGLVDAQGGLRSGPPRPLLDLAELGPCACDVVDDYAANYYAGGGYAGIQTKRGCALSCVYCTTPDLEGRRYRLRPLDQVIEEMRLLRDRWGVRHFFIVDAAFNHPLSSALAFCEALKAADLGVQWVAELNPRGVTEALCRAMAQAGCIGVTLGLESCSDTVLEAYQKGFDTGHILNCLRYLRSAGIPFDGSIILGGPGDTRDTFQETLDFCEQNLGDDVLRFFDGMVITQQSPAFAFCVKRGLIDPAVPFDEAVLANDFRRVRSYTHFFPDVVEDRKAFLSQVEAACARGTWIYNPKDCVPDVDTGEFALAPWLQIDPHVRPWYTSLRRNQ